LRVEPDSNILAETPLKAKGKANSQIVYFTPVDISQDNAPGQRMPGLAPFEVPPQDTAGAAKVIEVSKVLAIAG